MQAVGKGRTFSTISYGTEDEPDHLELLVRCLVNNVEGGERSQEIWDLLHNMDRILTSY